MKPRPENRTFSDGAATLGSTFTSRAVTFETAVATFAGLLCCVSVTVKSRCPALIHGAGTRAGRASTPWSLTWRLSPASAPVVGFVSGLPSGPITGPPSIVRLTSELIVKPDAATGNPSACRFVAVPAVT